MYGTLSGNIAAIIYYLYFQLIGLTVISLFFQREKPLSRLLMGSTAGSLLLTWLPILFAFFFGFTLPAHLAALFVTLPFLFFGIFRMRSQIKFTHFQSFFAELADHGWYLFILALFLIFWIYLLHTHTLLPGQNGSIYTGQSTYGDMSMHLGFITSLARQGAFPPDYSILPGTKLSYPFLSDSISSSLYLLGASLRLSYILPMIFAAAQIFTAVYLLGTTVFAYFKRPRSHAVLLTILLFFCNGGLGFAYFLHWPKEQKYHFSDIFTGFYTTPTNLVEQNIRWVNIIADMLLPQRATLFGYAVLFPALWMLYRAVFHHCRELYIPAGLFVAALPMIHTHSFLSAGIISAVWLLLWLYHQNNPEEKNLVFRHPGAWGLAVFTAVMCLLQYQNTRNAIAPEALMVIGILPFAVAVLYGIFLLCKYIQKFGWRELLSCWGIFLAIVLILALPQLLFWTFGQVAQGSFLRGHFNWGNQGDFYPWFYLKNIGAPLILIIGAVFSWDRKRSSVLLPAFFIWWLGELIVFTPNTYDNNKLLYVAYLLLCMGAADYGTDLYFRIKSPASQRSVLPGGSPSSNPRLGRWKCRFLCIAFLFLASFSGLLTLGRETLSRYQLYSTAQTALAEYAEKSTLPNAVFMTGTRHNNEITSLSGRSIVCGADTFLYFHGLDTTERKADLRLMYESPLDHMDLFQKYNVSYVVISNYECSSYTVNEEAFQNTFTPVFFYDDIVLYRINN